MSLPTDAAMPGHLPPAATAPWPIQPPPHGASAFEIPVRQVQRSSGSNGWAGALIAAAAAAAVGIAVTVPLLLGRKSASARRRSTRAKA